MQEASQIYSDNNLQQRQQNSRTVRCNYRSNQTENTNRSNSHNHADDFIGNLSQTIDGVLQSVSFFTDNSNTGTNEERENDDLQHVSFNHSFQRISRENVNDNLGNRRCSFSSNFSSISSHMQTNTRLHDSTDCQTDNDSKSSSYQIVRYGFNTDTAYLLISPRLVTPITRLENTSGTITILIMFMKIVPRGPIQVLAKPAPSAPSSRPAIIPSARPIKIL